MKSTIDGVLRLCIEIKTEEMRTWSAERIADFFDGLSAIARAVDANNTSAAPADPATNCGRAAERG